MFLNKQECEKGIQEQAEDFNSSSLCSFQETPKFRKTMINKYITSDN